MARTAADVGTSACRLNFYMSRYIMVAALSSIMTGLSYVGIIKIKIPEGMQPPHPAWQVTAFYVFACLAMGLSLFNLTVTSFCLVLAQAAVARVPRRCPHICLPTHPPWPQGLSLRGPPGSVARSVAIFRDQWVSIRTILQLSIICIVVAGAASTPPAGALCTLQHANCGRRAE